MVMMMIFIMVMMRCVELLQCIDCCQSFADAYMSYGIHALMCQLCIVSSGFGGIHTNQVFISNIYVRHLHILRRAIHVICNSKCTDMIFYIL